MLQSLNVFYPNDEAISELFYPSPIDGDDTVTLFEASIMIGERLLKGPSSLVLESPGFFAAELLNGAIDPRDPFTRVRWSHQPRQIPDLTWIISPDDLQAYALKRWGKGVYTDEELSGEPEAKPEAMPTTEPETAHTADQTPEAKPQRTDVTLYRIIRCLALALADKDPDNLINDGAPFIGFSKDKDRGIVGLLKSGGYSKLSGETIRRHIDKALTSK